MKLFSYMAAGRPIVASNLPSLREVLTEESAVFFTPDDPESLASAIRYICDSPERGALLAERAKTDVLRYSWDARARYILKFIS
jgi:glycosyltransferase involved in cell wall biosynthesis